MMGTGGYYDSGPTHRLARHVSLVSVLNPLSRAVGVSLAALTGAGLVILDEAVEHREGSSVHEIVLAMGLARFREVESMELRRAVSSSPPAILVLGEGALSTRSSRKAISRETHLVHLRPSSHKLGRVVDKAGNRNVTLLAEAISIPGDGLGERLRAIVGLRESEYAGARLVVEAEEGGSHRLATEIVSRLERDGAIVAYPA
jgi:shikimate kinase